MVRTWSDATRETPDWILRNLPCADVTDLREQSLDICHARQVVLPDKHFLSVVPGSKKLARDLLEDTQVVFFNPRQLVD